MSCEMGVVWTRGPRRTKSDVVKGELGRRIKKCLRFYVELVPVTNVQASA